MITVQFPCYDFRVLIFPSFVLWVAALRRNLMRYFTINNPFCYFIVMKFWYELYCNLKLEFRCVSVMDLKCYARLSGGKYSPNHRRNFSSFIFPIQL